MNEIERLLYINGRRLDAADLQLEQDYHVGVRRTLTGGLFTAGVVKGYPVTRRELPHGRQSSTEVQVGGGVALDAKGRELILRDSQTVRVPTKPLRAGLYFLVAHYEDETVAGVDTTCGEPLSEVGRVRQRVLLDWSERPPAHAFCGQPSGTELDCGVLLAVVHLNQACEIQSVDTSPRELAFPVNSSRTTAYVLEGEKDIDHDNPKYLKFPIKGSAPATASLYLWGDRFSSLYYTELGAHHHRFDPTAQTGPADTSLAPHIHPMPHTHSLEAATIATGFDRAQDLDSAILNGQLYKDPKTSGPGQPGYPAKPDGTPDPQGYGHGHKLQTTNSQLYAWGTQVETKQGHGDPNETSDYRYGNSKYPWVDWNSGVHTHDVTLAKEDGSHIKTDGPDSPNTEGAKADDGKGGQASHRHTELPDTLSTGQGDEQHVGKSLYTWPSDVKVSLDGADITAEILNLHTNWGTLGDGTDAHPFIRKDAGPNGTGPIDLRDAAAAVGKTLDVGTHTLKFEVADRAGGKVLWNLVIE